MTRNPNSPENLLTPWLAKMDDYAMECRVYDRELSGFAMALLAHILEFSDEHNKLYEMLLWLGTDEAKNYMATASDHSETLHREFQIINELTGLVDIEDDPEFVVEYLDSIRGWIEENRQDIPALLELN